MGLKESNFEGRYRRSRRRKVLGSVPGIVVLNPGHPNRSLFDLYHLPEPPVPNTENFSSNETVTLKP